MSLMEQIAAKENAAVKRNQMDLNRPRFVIEQPAHTKAFMAMAEDIAEAYEVTVDEIRGKSRQAQFVAARDHFVGLAASYGYPLPQIGFFLSRRDHTTVLRARNRYNGIFR